MGHTGVESVRASRGWAVVVALIVAAPVPAAPLSSTRHGAAAMLDLRAAQLDAQADLFEAEAALWSARLDLTALMGQPAAAAYLASRGAPVDLPGAAGLGRLDLVKERIDQDGGLTENQATARMKDAFSLACAYGRSEVINFLLNRGFEVDEELKGHGQGHTGLHVAAYHGHVDAVRTLLRHGARVDVTDKTWGTPPLVWALTGWSGRPTSEERYYDVVAQLVAAGATVKPELLEWDRARQDPRMLAALGIDATQ